MKQGWAVLIALEVGLIFSAAGFAQADSQKPQAAGGTKGVNNTIGTINVTRNINSGTLSSGSIRTTAGTIGPAGVMNMPGSVIGATGGFMDWSNRRGSLRKNGSYRK